MALFRAMWRGDDQKVSERERRLAEILDISPEALGTVRMGRRYHYRTFGIPKKNGEERHIMAPSPALKELQHRLLRGYLQNLPVHPAATAFRPGASIVRNAQRHAGQTVIITTDLADFFSSTTAHRVRTFFIRQGWRGKALTLLMRLCVYQNGLPQGAPTSPCLSNLVNVELDNTIDTLARRAGAIYTRYGDDLTFSWSSDEIPIWFQPAVERALLSAGYRIQPQKGWRVHQITDRPQITGVILKANGKFAPSKRLHRPINLLRVQIWWNRLTGHDTAQMSARLNGYRGFLRMFE